MLDVCVLDYIYAYIYICVHYMCLFVCMCASVEVYAQIMDPHVLSNCYIAHK